MTGCLDDIKTFSRLDKTLINLLLASAKNAATPAENVRRKACAWDWITQRKGAQNRSNYVALALDVIQKNSVAEIDEGILACLPSIHCPALNAHANVPHEKIFEIDATTPSMISLNVAVVYPVRARENIRAPKRDVEFPVRVPFRARRWCDLLDFLA